jgi:hypothetical protein
MSVLRCKVCGAEATITVRDGHMQKDVRWPEGKSPGRKGYAHAHMIACSFHGGLSFDEMAKHKDIEQVR